MLRHTLAVLFVALFSWVRQPHLECGDIGGLLTSIGWEFRRPSARLCLY